MYTKILSTLMLLAFLAAACAPGPGSEPQPTRPDSGAPVTDETPPAGGSDPVPYEPKPEDESLTRGEVFFEKEQVTLILMESYPIQVSLEISGSLPTPCHQLRAYWLTDEANGRVDVTLYSVSDPGMMCAQVLQDFSVALPLGSFAGGTYEVYINEVLVGSFDA